jgi:hypothetical protein
VRKRSSVSGKKRERDEGIKPGFEIALAIFSGLSPGRKAPSVTKRPALPALPQ